MALFAMIKGEATEITLNDRVIASYHFGYSLADNCYAKTYPECIKIHIDVDVYQLLSSEEAPLKENEKTLEALRAWGIYKFGDKSPENEYYRELTMTHTHGEELFRRIDFSHAYLESFSEIIEPETGRHILRLELLQKEDLLNNVSV